MRDEPQSAGKDPSETFQEFIKLYGERAYNFAFRLSGNDADARDLVQEAFTRAFEHQDRYDPARPFSSWLFRILHNIYLDGVRRHEHKHSFSLDAQTSVEDGTWQEAIAGSAPDPGDIAVQRETEAMIQQALGSLPMQYRAAVTLCDVEGLAYDKSSEVMSCPVGTVRSRIHQGRVLLKAAFEKLQKKGVS